MSLLPPTPDGDAAGPVDLDALTLDDVRAGALRGRPVTVLGLARSGIALARFLADAGAAVTVYDGRPRSELARGVEALGERRVTLALGPEVDPAGSWADAALVATSPSITPDYPTTEPRLRAALRALVERRAGGDRSAPPLVAEADLFLRLCPAPTVGVTGTKGKTTTASLAHALLAADPVRPAVLGGNIGVPLVERLPELTPDHRVVIELSELQLPALRRGTTVAVYTNVTSDHLDRHGTVEAYRRVKRRLAELVDPDGALVLNLADPVVGGYAGLGTAPVVPYRDDRPVPGGLGVVDGWLVAAGVDRLPLAGGGLAATGPGGRLMPVDELAIPGRHNVANALAALAVGLLFGIAPDALRRAAAAFAGVEHRLEVVALRDGVRYVNDSQGTQPDAVIAALRAFPAPVVLVAGGRDKGVDLGGLADVVAERAVGGRPHRRERAGPRGAVPGGGARTDRPGGVDGRGGRARGHPRPGGARLVRDDGRRPGDGAAQPGGGVVRHVRGLRGPGPRVHGGGRRAPPGRKREGAMSLTMPLGRVAATRRGNLQRERHEPEYGILVAVVALTAIGILMVYSSSAMKAYLQRDDTFAIVGPQIQWAALGVLAMLAVMRVDYRYLRVASVPMFLVAVALLILVFVPALNVVVGGSARWLRIGPLPAVHPAEFAKLALVVYLAHWFAKRGSAVGGFRHGTIPFLVIVVPVVVLVLREPDLGTARSSRSPRSRCSSSPGRACSTSSGWRRPPSPRWCSCSSAATSWTAWPHGSTPGRTRPGSASTASRASSRSPSAACSGPGSGRAASPGACSCPTPRTTSSSRSSGRSSGSSARSSSWRCSSPWATSGSGRRSGHRTRSGRSSPRGSPRGCASRRSSTWRSSSVSSR